MMLVGLAVKGFAIEGNDGKLGTASDFLFDDTTWKIRWRRGGNYLGFYPYGVGAAFKRSPYRAGSDLLETERSGSLPDDDDPHLRSVTAVVSYHIQAEDGPIGHVENFLADDANWGIRYLIIDTKNWWPGRHVLVSPYAIGEISWSERDVTLRVTREQVKSSPAWNPAETIDRDYEERLHGHYGWPGYGW